MVLGALPKLRAIVDAQLLIAVPILFLPPRGGQSSGNKKNTAENETGKNQQEKPKKEKTRLQARYDEKLFSLSDP